MWRVTYDVQAERAPPVSIETLPLIFEQSAAFAPAYELHPIRFDLLDGQRTLWAVVEQVAADFLRGNETTAG